MFVAENLGKFAEAMNHFSNNMQKQLPEADKKKFMNITNGVTVRRWVAEANPALAELYTDYLGTNDFLFNFNIIRSLNTKIGDVNFTKKWRAVKLKAKIRAISVVVSFLVFIVVYFK